jgi:hypothetical protein
MVIVPRIGERDGRLDVHMSAIRTNQGKFVGRDGIGHGKNAVITLGKAGEGEADACVAAGAFYDDPAGLEEAFAFCFFH